MDKSRLKVFALEGRKELISKVKNRFEKLGINKKGIDNLNIQIMGDKIEIDGKLFSKSSYDNLINKYNQIGYDELVEESVYIWFNRLVALAFMESNDYIEERFIFSDGGKINPEIIDNYYTMDFFDELEESEKNKIHNLKDKNTNDSIDEMYSILLEEKCFELSKIMPFMFDKKGGYADILFPENLLMPDSFLMKLREVFEDSKEYNESKDEKIVPVEIIGWLYQYYNSELKDEVFADLKKNKKITKEKIAPATQLFTPHWIVKYMAENSLGKLAIENCGVNEELKENWKYYIGNSDSEKDSERLNIEDIKIIDPAMGSGHMLTYCFDLLMEIYDNLGWGTKDSVISILKNNIYGLEIDKRAGQLASFAIFMKGREYFSRLFKVAERENINLNTFWIDESDEISDEIRKIIYENSLKNLETLLSNFTNAKEYGSILKISDINLESLNIEIEKLDNIYHSQGQLSLMTGEKAVLDFEKEYEKIKKIARQQKIFQNKFDIVITNPPYMGGKGYSEKLKKYVEKNYKDSKGDLFAVFIEKCNEMTKKDRYTSMITMQSWMFLSSFENLRKMIIDKTEIQSLNHLGTRAFEEIGGEVVSTVSWISKKKIPNEKGIYIRLVDYNDAQWKEEEFFNKENYYQANQKDFEKIPSSPIAYWVSDKIREIFENNNFVKDNDMVITGMSTGKNDIYLRLWQEINLKSISLYAENIEEINLKEKEWIPYNKGGNARKYYGSNEYVVKWSQNLKFHRPRSTFKEYYLKSGLTWSFLTSSIFSMRFFEKGFLWDVAGSPLFVKDEKLTNYYLGFFCSKIGSYFMNLLNPTLNFQVIDIQNMPIKISQNKMVKNKVNELVQQNINIAKEEWDSRETSWDFKKLFITNGSKISDSYKNYCNHWRDNFVQMHKNEEENIASENNDYYIGKEKLLTGVNDKIHFLEAVRDIEVLKKKYSVSDFIIVQSIKGKNGLTETYMKKFIKAKYEYFNNNLELGYEE